MMDSMRTELVSAIHLQEVELQDKAAETRQDGTTTTTTNNNNNNNGERRLLSISVFIVQPAGCSPRSDAVAMQSKNPGRAGLLHVAAPQQDCLTIFCPEDIWPVYMDSCRFQSTMKVVLLVLTFFKASS